MKSVFFILSMMAAFLPLNAQSPATNATGVPSGAPDLQGLWLSKWIVNMADGRFAEKTVDVPFTEWGKELWTERTASLQKDDPTLNCWPTGVPRQAGTPYPMQIIQTPTQAVILYEGAAHTYRVIPTDGTPHGPFDQLWMGDSVGRYEGDTLVVDVVNFNDKTWLDSSGHPHSDKLHITERYRKTDEDTLRYEVTIDDPVAYEKPWTTTYVYKRQHGALMEYWCTENNKDKEHMVGK